RPVAHPGAARLFQLPRDPDELPPSTLIPIPRPDALVAHATATQPAAPVTVVAHGLDRAGVPAAPPYPSSLARRSLCRQPPEARAQCVNRARWDLCGGSWVTGFPTAI